MVEPMTDWTGISRRNARSVQTAIGWIYWDPGALARYAALGVEGPLGYIAVRAAPLASAGAEAVVAAFGSITPLGIAIAMDVVERNTTYEELCAARDEAVLEGLAEHAPSLMGPLADFGPRLWDVVDRLPRLGRVFFAAHLHRARPEDPVLSGWHAVNCMREWRGDTHWAIVAASGLTGAESSILHNAWVGYEGDWLAQSRGSTSEEVAAGWASLADKGLAVDGEVTPAGIRLRQEIEDRTDTVGEQPWRLLGEEDSVRFAEAFEGPCELLLARVDETAGTKYMPASRVR